jgi:hypothetical protein
MRKEGLTALVAILVVASLGIGYLSGNTRATETMTSVSTSTVTSTVTYNATYQQVAYAYIAHLTQLNDRDVTGLGNDYESNATVVWTGDALWGLYFTAGTYSGVSNIRILWGSTIGKFINFSVSDEQQSIGIKGDVSLVNSTFDFRGWADYAATCGSTEAIMNGSVVAQDVYAHVSNNNSLLWSIARENWNFTQSNVQCIPATTQSSSTSTTTTTPTTTTFTVPTCYETLDTVINPAPKGTVYMKVVTDQQGTAITNGTLYVTQFGTTANGGGREAGYCIELSDVNSTGYLQLAGNATFIATGYYNLTLMAGYNQGPWYLATIPLIQAPPNSNSTVYVTVSVPSGVVTVVTSSWSEGSGSNTTVTTTTTTATTIKVTGG